MEMSPEAIDETSSIQSKWKAWQSYAFVGIGCGFHKNFDLICVIDLAGGYEDHLELLQSRRTNNQVLGAFKPPQQDSPSKGYELPSQRQQALRNQANKENESPINGNQKKKQGGNHEDVKDKTVKFGGEVIQSNQTTSRDLRDQPQPKHRYPGEELTGQNGGILKTVQFDDLDEEDW